MTLSHWIAYLKGGKSIYHFTELMRLSQLPLSSLNQAIHRLQKKKVLFRLAKGFYANSFVLPSLEEASCILYPPCYISMESALMMHGISDQVPQVLTCVSINKTKAFQTDLGEVNYSHIKKECFFGFELVDRTALALPEKAALDFVYIKRQNGLKPALDEWNWSYLDVKKLHAMAESFPSSVRKHLTD